MSVRQFNSTYSNVTEAGLAQHMRQIFNYMTGGVALSGLTAWLTLSSPALMAMSANAVTQIIFLVIWFGFGFFMHKIITSMPPKGALGVFMGFSALTGFAFAPAVALYTQANIALAFFTTAFMFGGAAAYGYFSQKSLSGWGNFLMMGAWGLIGAVIVNLVVAIVTGGPIAGLSFVISLIAVPLFAGMTAWETNMLKEQYAHLANDEHTRASTAIYGATTLYLNFVVMFMHMLHLLGVMNDD